MNELPETLTIGVLAEAAGVNVETIRFYQRKGLMLEPDRPLSPNDLEVRLRANSIERLVLELQPAGAAQPEEALA